LWWKLGANDSPEALQLVVVPVRRAMASRARAIRSGRRERCQRREKTFACVGQPCSVVVGEFPAFQLEKSKQQWVQDIDAITDFIVVHDRTWKIVRTNRSLADHLGMPPVALVGGRGSLRQLAEGDGSLPCPFCLDTGVNRKDVISSAEKLLVSTSRASGDQTMRGTFTY
jgi:hypothetical protein